MKKIFFISIVVILAFSCENKDNKLQTDMRANAAQKTAVNDNNPYDSVGIKHNLILNDFVSSDSVSEISSFSDAEDTIQQLALNLMDYQNINNIQISDEFLDFIDTSATGSNFDNYLNLSYLDEEDSTDKALLRLFEIVGGDLNYEDKISAIESFEDSILNEALEIPSENEAMVLQAASIARHSTQLWEVDQSDLMQTASEPILIGVIAGADLVGFIVGFFDSDCEEDRWKCGGYGAAVFSGLAALVWAIGGDGEQ